MLTDPRPRLDDAYEAKLLRQLDRIDPSTTTDEHRRWIDATIDFLGWCTLRDAPPLAPCPQVDVVWHEMLMFTADYRRFCEQLNVKFVDHEPIDEPRPDSPSAARTLAFVRGLGIRPAHEDLWSFAGAARCCGGHVPA